MLMDLEISDKTFKVAIADTDELRYRGLSNLPKLGKYKGMLFILPQKTEVNMVMRDMLIPLDFVFLDENFVVTKTGTLEKDESGSIHSDRPIQMVLELNKGIVDEYRIRKGNKLFPSKELTTHLEGVKKFKHGGRFELVGDKVFEVKVDDIKIDPNKLQILNNDGEVVANISSGSRIFSREDTKALITKFKKGDKLGLAEYMIATIIKQDSQKPDFVNK